MIVEFCGIPGGGKSTLVAAYVARYQKESITVSLDMYHVVPELWYAFVFFIRHPVAFFFLFQFVLRHHVRGLFWYSFHLLLRACGKYAKARLSSARNVIIIDEGLLHIIITLSGVSLSEKELDTLLAVVPLPDVVCIASSGTFHRFHNTHAPRHPRVQQGSAALTIWKDVVTKNCVTVSERLAFLQIPLWNIQGKQEGTVQESVTSLRSFLSSVPPSSAGRV